MLRPVGAICKHFPYSRPCDRHGHKLADDSYMYMLMSETQMLNVQRTGHTRCDVDPEVQFWSYLEEPPSIALKNREKSISYNVYIDSYIELMRAISIKNTKNPRFCAKQNKDISLFLKKCKSHSVFVDPAIKHPGHVRSSLRTQQR